MFCSVAKRQRYPALDRRRGPGQGLFAGWAWRNGGRCPMPPESHRLMDGALHVDRRENSRYWQCSFCLGSRNHRQTTKEVSLAAAKDFARLAHGALCRGSPTPTRGRSFAGWPRPTSHCRTRRVGRWLASANATGPSFEASRAGAKCAKPSTARCCSWGNTGHRPDESARHELRDVKIVNDQSTGERILGDRGLRHAGRAFLRVDARLRLIEGRTFMRSPRLAAPAWR